MANVEKKQITITEVLKHLENGHDREWIRKEYDLKKSELKRLFENPKLKGKKVRHARERDSFVLVDDTATAETATATAAPQTEATTATETTTSEETSSAASDNQGSPATEESAETAY